jgi:hypothetical protein
MTRLFMLPVLVALVAACGDSHPVSIDFPSPDVGISAATVGAFVLNRGNGQPSATDPCNFREFLTWDVTNIQSPSGTQMLFCKFKGLPRIERAEHVKGYECFLPGGAITYNSHFRRAPSGTASLTCTYGED